MISPTHRCCVATTCVPGHSGCLGTGLMIFILFMFERTYVGCRLSSNTSEAPFCRSCLHQTRLRAANHLPKISSVGVRTIRCQPSHRVQLSSTSYFSAARKSE